MKDNAVKKQCKVGFCLTLKSWWWSMWKHVALSWIYLSVIGGQPYLATAGLQSSKVPRYECNSKLKNIPPKANKMRKLIKLCISLNVLRSKTWFNNASGSLGDTVLISMKWSAFKRGPNTAREAPYENTLCKLIFFFFQLSAMLESAIKNHIGN